MVHPEFQLNWIKDPIQERKARRWLGEEFAKFVPRPSMPLPAADPQPAPAEKSARGAHVYDFQKPAATVAATPDRANDEIDRFFAFPSDDLSCLDKLPTLKKMFIKYNTPIPSSAAVERIFSVGGDLFTKKRAKLGDENFENLILLKFKRNDKKNK